MADKQQSRQSSQARASSTGAHELAAHDAAHVRAIAGLLASNPDLAPSAAIKTLGITDPSVIRRLRSAVEAQLQLTPEMLGEQGRAMSERLMPEVAAKHPEDSVVMFLVKSGTYITAKDDTTLLDKYEALHHDEWGWVTDIVRGQSDRSEGVGRP
jgi:hypothetical protein